MSLYGERTLSNINFRDGGEHISETVRFIHIERVSGQISAGFSYLFLLRLCGIRRHTRPTKVSALLHTFRT